MENSVYLHPHTQLYSLPNGVKDTIDTNGVLTKRVKKDTASGVIAVNTTNYPLAKNGGQFVNYLTAGGMEIGIIGTDSTTGAGTLYYELALPVTHQTKQQEHLLHIWNSIHRKCSCRWWTV